MSDDGGGDCGGGECDGGDIGGGSFEAGGGEDGGVCIDPAECTEITFAENTEYIGDCYDNGSTVHDVHHRHYSNHNNYITDPCGRCVIITILMGVFLWTGKFKINLFSF